MGGIVNLLSHPVISGFINAAAIMIILSQLTAFTGIPAIDGSPFAQARHLSPTTPPSIRSRWRSVASSLALLWLVQRFGYYLVLPFLRRVGRNHPITRIGPMLVAICRDRRGGRVRPRSALRRRDGRADRRRVYRRSRGRRSTWRCGST